MNYLPHMHFWTLGKNMYQVPIYEPFEFRTSLGTSILPFIQTLARMQEELRKQAKICENSKCQVP